MSFLRWLSEGEEPFTGGGVIDLRIKVFGAGEFVERVDLEDMVRRDIDP